MGGDYRVLRTKFIALGVKPLPFFKGKEIKLSFAQTYRAGSKAPPLFEGGGWDDCMDAGGRVTQDAVTEGVPLIYQVGLFFNAKNPTQILAVVIFRSRFCKPLQKV
jgi:hypothetical protein